MKSRSTITRIILSWTGVNVAAILVFQPALAQTPSPQACKGAINQPSQSSQTQKTWWMKDQPGTSRALFYPTSTTKTKEDSRPNGFNPVQTKRYTRNNLDTALAAFRACQLEQLRIQQVDDKKE